MTALAHLPPAPPAPDGALSLLVRDIDRSVPGIASFTLVSPDGGRLPSYVPGSHILVHTAPPTGTAGTSGTAGRANAYSLTGDGVFPTEYRISVLRQAAGSRLLHDRTRVGDLLTVAPPRSTFPPATRAAKHLFLAGGIGITPIVSQLRHARRWGQPVQVLYTHQPGRGAHVADVTALAGDDAEIFTSASAFRDAAYATLREQPVGTHLYVCGPAALIAFVLAAAADARWPHSRVHSERFTADPAEAAEPFRARLTESGITVDVPAGTSLLNALEATGTPLTSMCRTGVCGYCRLPLTGGVPIHRDIYLSQEEKDSGTCVMPCVSRAYRGQTLELPL